VGRSRYSRCRSASGFRNTSGSGRCLHYGRAGYDQRYFKVMRPKYSPERYNIHRRPHQIAVSYHCSFLSASTQDDQKSVSTIRVAVCLAILKHRCRLSLMLRSRILKYCSKLQTLVPIFFRKLFSRFLSVKYWRIHSRSSVKAVASTVADDRYARQTRQTVSS